MYFTGSSFILNATIKTQLKRFKVFPAVKASLALYKFGIEFVRPGHSVLDTFLSGVHKSHLCDDTQCNTNN